MKLDFTTELPYGRLVWADLDHACVWVIQSEYKDHFSVYVIRDFARIIISAPRGPLSVSVCLLV